MEFPSEEDSSVGLCCGHSTREQLGRPVNFKRVVELYTSMMLAGGD